MSFFRISTATKSFWRSLIETIIPVGFRANWCKQNRQVPIEKVYGNSENVIRPHTTRMEKYPILQ